LFAQNILRIIVLWAKSVCSERDKKVAKAKIMFASLEIEMLSIKNCNCDLEHHPISHSMIPKSSGKNNQNYDWAQLKLDFRKSKVWNNFKCHLISFVIYCYFTTFSFKNYSNIFRWLKIYSLYISISLHHWLLCKDLTLKLLSNPIWATFSI
jgi:hypothetical protein